MTLRPFGSLLLGVAACAPTANSPIAQDDSGHAAPSACNHDIAWHTKFEAPSKLPWPLSETDDSGQPPRRTRALDVYEAKDATIVYVENDEAVSSSSVPQQVRCATGVSGPCFHDVSANRYRSKLVAYDAATEKELWHAAVPDRGHWGVAGRWVVDASATDVHVYDATTGALVRTIDAIAGDVCASQDGTAWIDDRVGLDPETGRVYPRGDGDPCPAGATRAIASGITDCAAAEVGIGDPFSYNGAQAFVNGADGAALVGTSGGRMLATFDTRGHRIRGWTSLALEHPEQSTMWGRADLAYGRLIAVYGDWLQHPRLTAFDASTGKRLWDVSTPEFGDLVLTPARVYVTGGTHVFRVHDAATGNVLSAT
jgi:outer membrane protein assembly factor BamB